MAHVVDWMTPTPITVTPNTPLARAGVLMSRHRIRHLPVTGEDGRLIGIATDYAVFGRGVLVGGGSELWFPYSADELDAEIGDVMERVELTAVAEDDLARTLRKLVVAGQDAVICVDDKLHPIGILTEHDPVRYAAGLLDPDRPASMDASTPVHTIELASSLGFAHREMLSRALRHLVVVDREGTAQAVISYRDVVSAEAHVREDASVADAVRSFNLHWRPARDTSTVSCAQLMASEHIGCVPLLDAERRPAAIVTRTDICDAVAFAFEQEELFDMV